MLFSNTFCKKGVTAKTFYRNFFYVWVEEFLRQHLMMREYICEIEFVIRWRSARFIGKVSSQEINSPTVSEG